MPPFYLHFTSLKSKTAVYMVNYIYRIHWTVLSCAWPKVVHQQETAGLFFILRPSEENVVPVPAILFHVLLIAHKPCVEINTGWKEMGRCWERSQTHRHTHTQTRTHTHHTQSAACLCVCVCVCVCVWGVWSWTAGQLIWSLRPVTEKDCSRRVYPREMGLACTLSEDSSAALGCWYV